MPQKENSTVIVSCAFDRANNPDGAVLIIGRPSATGMPKVINGITGKKAIELWDELTKPKHAK